MLISAVPPSRMTLKRHHESEYTPGNHIKKQKTKIKESPKKGKSKCFFYKKEYLA